MPWSFPGILRPVSCVYTQTTGFDPDVASLVALPQDSNFPAQGTLTMSWDGTSVTLPQCLIDLSSVRFDGGGRQIHIVLKDRRVWWTRAAPVSGSYNVPRAGGVSRPLGLRDMASLLLTAIGEPSANVSVLPNDHFIPVHWQNADPLTELRQLLDSVGYSLTLGFGTEPVKVVRLGTGLSLPTTLRFVYTDAFDPAVPPRWAKVVFEPSWMQARFFLEAVGRETDGSWKPINELSYAPDTGAVDANGNPVKGWELTPPVSVQPDGGILDADDKEQADGYVRRAYRIKGFAAGSPATPADPNPASWAMPDGSGTVNQRWQVLPLKNHLLAADNTREDESYRRYLVYGRYTKEEDDDNAAAPPNTDATAVGDRVKRSHVFDGEEGMVFFNRPIFLTHEGKWYPAELYLECTFELRQFSTGTLVCAESQQEVAASGVGYHTIRLEDRKKTVVEYSASQTQVAVSTNQGSLDTKATAAINASQSLWAPKAGQHCTYATPQLGLRCDGAVLQVQHILTCGEGAHAVNRTIASRQIEFDRGVPSSSVRRAHAMAILGVPAVIRWQQRAIREWGDGAE
jgi:hypothetical protein